jgi:site-specific recombinase XerD
VTTATLQRGKPVAGQQYETGTLSPAPPRTGPLDSADTGAVIAYLEAMPIWTTRPYSRLRQRLNGAERVLDWLAAHPGPGWQARWLTAGADADTSWMGALAAGPGSRPAIGREVVTDGVTTLLLGRVVLPGYGFLHRYRTTALFRDARKLFGAQAFAAVAEAGAAAGLSRDYQDAAERCLVKVVLRTGRDLHDLTAADLLDFRAWALASRGKLPTGLHAAWDLLRATGILPDAPPLRRVGHGQLTCAQLADRYGIACRPVRDMFVRYLEERRPALDYGSLQGLAAKLIGNFWADLERHHPGIGSLRLDAPVAEAWKQRVSFVARPGKPPAERKNRLGVLMTVRAFYLDITQWALEDPFWVPWAVPSPVRQADLAGLGKQKKSAQARSHQRVRQRLPRLPDLVAAAETHLAQSQDLLAAAHPTATGDSFEHDGRTWQRLERFTNGASRRQANHDVAVLAADPEGVQHDLTRQEDEAFWAWAIIETLRHTGVRCEELLETTQLALVSYRLADSGETVPLLQIVPSKSNEERLLLVSPELASVLATIITRLRDSNHGAIPLVARFDPIERTLGPELPHLFQRRLRWKRDVITPKMVSDLIGGTVTRSGLTDQAGTPLEFRPHDFRRIFTTEAVAAGLPVHIAARLLGHASVTTVEPYLAVFQEDLIRSYRTFLDTRRATRPAEEYREPTDAEWHEFQQHFLTRKLELGDCARPYGTPCIHEHSCIRCPMLRVDPAQRPRLAAIIKNLAERIGEARANGWLGEVNGLQVSLTKAREKLAALDRSQARLRQSRSVHLGIPALPKQGQSITNR